MMCVFGTGGPQWCLPAVPQNIIDGLRGHDPVEIAGASGGCYLFTNDGSEREAFIPWSAPRAPARSTEGVAHWLGTAGLKTATYSTTHFNELTEGLRAAIFKAETTNAG